MDCEFDRVWDRTGHDAMKWEFPQYEQCSVHTEAKDIIPMWVADMDFAAPACVTDALRQRLDHPIFGYFGLPPRYVEAVRLWQKTRFGVDYPFTRANILYQNSVLGGMAAFLTAYTLPGEQVLVNTPAYNGFVSVIANLGRTLCPSPLVQDENGVFRLDLADMEKKIIEKKISVLLFCSPQNPTGRVWERGEIEQVVDLCDRHGVKIISDEIWADLVTDPACRHLPTQSVSARARQITMALYAPTKTFNIAGLVGAYSIIYDPQMANKIAAVSTATHYNGPNILSCWALIGGYEGGAGWLDELNRYLRGNTEYVVNYLTSHFEGVRVTMPQATYLVWADLTRCGDTDALYRRILDTGVLPSNGRSYLSPGWVRFNVACPRSQCEEAMRRLDGVLPAKK